MTSAHPPSSYRRAVKIDRLTPHPRNPRQGDVGAIHTSIEANGFVGAIVVQASTGYVLAGNHRLIAARQAGMTTVPVVFVDVDDAHALRILLADNRTSDLADNDDAQLAELLTELAADGDLVGTGYDGDDLDALMASLAPAEDAAAAGSGAGEGERVELCDRCPHRDG